MGARLAARRHAGRRAAHGVEHARDAGLRQRPGRHVEEDDRGERGGLQQCRAQRDAAAERVADDGQRLGELERAGGGEDIPRQGGRVRAGRQRRRGTVAGEVEGDDAEPRVALGQRAGQRGEVARAAEKAVQQHDGPRAVAGPHVGEDAHASRAMRAGSSSNSFRRTRNETAWAPSTSR